MISAGVGGGHRVEQCSSEGRGKGKLLQALIHILALAVVLAFRRWCARKVRNAA